MRYLRNKTNLAQERTNAKALSRTNAINAYSKDLLTEATALRGRRKSQSLPAYEWHSAPLQLQVVKYVFVLFLFSLVYADANHYLYPINSGGRF